MFCTLQYQFQLNIFKSLFFALMCHCDDGNSVDHEDNFCIFSWKGAKCVASILPQFCRIVVPRRFPVTSTHQPTHLQYLAHSTPPCLLLALPTSSHSAASLHNEEETRCIVWPRNCTMSLIFMSGIKMQTISKAKLRAEVKSDPHSHFIQNLLRVSPACLRCSQVGKVARNWIIRSRPWGNWLTCKLVAMPPKWWRSSAITLPPSLAKHQMPPSCGQKPAAQIWNSAGISNAVQCIVTHFSVAHDGK